ncbi:MAG: multidrug resistance protein [Chloroflexi bacterium]|nr:multidrug resistance protein [Chloroflexota bacterium]
MRAIAYILLSGILGVAGQIVLKQGVTILGPLSLSPTALITTAAAILQSPLIILGLGIYGSGTFFWLLALSQLDLSYAYPFASLNYIAIVLASWGILGERPTLGRLIGIAAIGVGVWAVTRTRPTTGRHARGTRRIPIGHGGTR